MSQAKNPLSKGLDLARSSPRPVWLAYRLFTSLQDPGLAVSICLLLKFATDAFASTKIIAINFYFQILIYFYLREDKWRKSH